MNQLKSYKRDGKTVIDATEELVLNVEPKDRRKAVPGDDHNCVLAQCLKRFPWVSAVSIGATVVLVERASDGVWLRYRLSGEDRKMVKAYDPTGYFRPGTYTLLPPKPSTRIGARAGQKPGSNKRTGKARRVTKTPAQPYRHLSAPA